MARANTSTIRRLAQGEYSFTPPNSALGVKIVLVILTLVNALFILASGASIFLVSTPKFHYIAALLIGIASILYLGRLTLWNLFGVERLYVKDDGIGYVVDFKYFTNVTDFDPTEGIE